MMKASLITGYGGTEMIRSGDLPEPVLTDGKVLISVKFASVNPIDYMIRRGMIRWMTGRRFPKILGADFSGMVEATGKMVKDFQKGDRVYGICNLFFGHPGAFSERIAVSPKRIRKMPEGMSFEDAAALQVAGLTALSGLRKAGDLRGKKLLVNGASGGVGHLAVQIGKAKGAMVTGVCNRNKLEFVRQLGAETVLDYEEGFSSIPPKKFDVIFDAFGKMDHDKIRSLLIERGIYLSTLFLPPSQIHSLYFRLVYNKILTSANMRGKPSDYKEIERLYLRNKIRPFLCRIFPPDETREAFEMLEQAKATGKILIRWGDMP